MSDDSSSSTIAVRPQGRSGWITALVVLLAVIFLYFFSQAVGALLLGLYVALQHWSQSQVQQWLTTTVDAQFIFSLLADGILVLGVAGMLRLLKWKWADIGLTRPALWQLLLGVAAAVPYYVLYFSLVAVISRLIPAFNPAQKQELGFESVHGTVALTLTFISLVILPPLAEEITMRGLLYTGLKKWLPRIAAALAVSLLFGAAHLAEGGDSGPLWIGALDTFTLSIVLIFLREKTGNLWSGIVLHAVKNAVAFASLFLIASR